MTTLHVDRAQLESIAAQFPTVASISIDPNFPHGMRIEVTERPPTMVVDSGAQQMPVAADGTLLTGVEVSDDDHLPVLEVAEPPTGAKLAGVELDQALVVGAAPSELRPLIEKIGFSKEFGVEVTLRGGIPGPLRHRSQRGGEVVRGSRGARRSEADDPLVSRCARSGAAGGGRGEHRHSLLRPSSLDRDFRNYVNLRVRIEG